MSGVVQMVQYLWDQLVIYIATNDVDPIDCENDEQLKELNDRIDQMLAIATDEELELITQNRKPVDPVSFLKSLKKRREKAQKEQLH